MRQKLGRYADETLRGLLFSFAAVLLLTCAPDEEASFVLRQEAAAELAMASQAIGRLELVASALPSGTDTAAQRHVLEQDLGELTTSLQSAKDRFERGSDREAAELGRRVRESAAATELDVRRALAAIRSGMVEVSGDAREGR